MKFKPRIPDISDYRDGAGACGVPMADASSEKSWSWLERSFRATRWTMIRRLCPAAAGEGPGGAEAEQFCQAYWYPLYSFLRHRGYAAPDAQDYVQSFMSSVLEKEWLARADPARGKLRNFLITLLLRHIAEKREWQGAKKRGGGMIHVPLDWNEAEAAWRSMGKQAESPEDAFRRALASQLVAAGIKRLEHYYAIRKKDALLADLLPALEGSAFFSHEEIGARQGMSRGAVTMAVRQLRERFKGFVMDAAAGLMGLPVGPELEAELAGLFLAESSGLPGR